MTIYLCLRGMSLAKEMKPIANIFIDMAVTAMEIESYKPPHSVLFAMDEFNTLGRQDTIDRAMGLIAGFGVKLWPVFQSIDQLKACFPGTWDNFIRNCSAVQYAGDHPADVIQDMEKRIGDIVTKTKDGRIERHPLLSAYELSTNYFVRESRREIIFFQQRPAAPLEFIDYYRHPWLASLAEDLPKVAQPPATKKAWALKGRSVRALKQP